MLDKLIGVSPPQKGEAPDSKLADGKDLRGTSKSEYKKDFEKALGKKLDKQEKKADSPATRKEVIPKSEELRADRKDKKSLGGIKKKVTEDDDKMVSNLMASNESKVEIPDSKIENPAEIENVIPQKNKINADSAVSAALFSQMGLMQTAVPQTVLPEEVQNPMPLSLQKIAEPKLATIENGDLSSSALSRFSSAMPEQLRSPASAVQLQEELQPAGHDVVPAVDQAAPQAFNLEAELAAAVGFNPDAGLKQSSGELLQKMKAFDADKNSDVEKNQTFEKNILSRLQNEQAKNVVQMSEKNFSGENPGGDSGREGSSAQLKDFKSDLTNANQLTLASGQTQTEFKSQIGLATAAQSHSLTGKLEENREANISEIMSKAQYLVTKGGGEVSVKMSPDGLGELHLKVMFQDGKLNIEMQTQNKDIKKLVEDSLSELKSGLAAHRLSLEHVKINTVNATNADNNTQFQSNLNQGRESHENAREQWKDFQGNMNNQSGKNSSQSSSDIRTQLPSRSGVSGAATAANALRTYGGTKGATVNRVA